MTESSEQTIVFDNVSKFYGEILGVNRVTLAIPPGITSLVGPNGAGKTTSLRCLSGIIPPTRGTIRIGRPARSRRLLRLNRGRRAWHDSRCSAAQGRPGAARR